MFCFFVVCVSCVFVLFVVCVVVVVRCFFVFLVLLLFLVLFVFIVGLIYAYKKDIAKSPWYFKGSYKIILTLIGVYMLYFITVRYIL